MMTPEIITDTAEHVVGVIVPLPLGRYRASIRTNLHGYSEESLIFQKTFDQLEKARRWITAKAHSGTVKVA